MKCLNPSITVAFLLVVSICPATAQSQDSVVFGKIKKNAKIYDLNYLGIKELEFKLAKPTNLFIPKMDSIGYVYNETVPSSSVDSLDQSDETQWVFLNQFR